MYYVMSSLFPQVIPAYFRLFCVCVFFFVAVAQLNVVQIMHRELNCFFRLSMFSLPRLICIYGGTKARLVWCSSLKCKLERDNLREPCLQNSNANFGIKKVSIACGKNTSNHTWEIGTVAHITNSE